MKPSKLSRLECELFRLRIAEIQPKLTRAENELREMPSSDPDRGDLVVRAARLFAEKARLERWLAAD
jgi:hypothetical protein